MAELSDLQRKYGTGNLTPEQMLYMDQLRPQSGSEVAKRIIKESSPELKPAPGNFFQRAATGAGQAADLVNKHLPKALVVPDKYVEPSKLTQTIRETQVPTSLKFFPSVDTMTGEMQPAGFGEGRMPAGKILDAIKPADLLGITGAQKTYSALGYGQTPEPMDVLDTFGLGAGMAQLGRTGFRGASKVARAGAPYAAEGLERMVEKYDLDPRMYVVKPKGGNWLTGAVEDETKGLQKIITGQTAEERIPLHERLLADPDLNQDQLDRVQYHLDMNKRDAAVDKWINKKLTNYIKNEMASPEDQIRLGIERRAAAAEELKATNQARIDKMVSDIERAKAAGKDTTLSENDLAAAREKFADEEYIASQGLHHDFIPEEGWDDAVIWEPEYLEYARNKAGFPKEGMATHPASKDWEIKSDSEITSFLAGDLQSPHLADTPLLEQNQWINKVDPNTRINRLDQGAVNSAGFTHMVDELRNAVDPESALPSNLKISTKDLEKMTVDDVSALVGKINAWRNVQKTKSDLQIANNPATQTFKEYPPENNPKGVSWRQIKRPEGYSDEEAEKFVREATRYEGDIMRHCVGGAGHCEPLLNGDVEIYTLRDAKGEPHVTIEVEPGKWDWAFIKEDGGNPIEVIKEAETRIGITPENREEVVKNWGSQERYEKQKQLNNLVDEIYREKTGKAPPSRILEIKGKNNQKPKDEYIPFVQDFVKSQNWADVGDIKNTDLFRVTEGQKLPGFSKDIPPGYYTLDDFQKMAVENEMPEEILENWMSKLKERDRRGYAEGGEVEMAEGGSVYDVLDMADKHFSSQLRNYRNGGVFHMAEGGTPEIKQEFRSVEPEPIMGSIASGLTKASNYLKSRPAPESVMEDTEQRSPAYRDAASAVNNVLELVDTFFVNDLAKTAERLSYGDRLTSGKGQTLKILPETIGAATMVAPPAAKLAGKTAKVVQKVAPDVAETAAQMAERYAMKPMYAVPDEGGKFLPTVLPRTRRSPEEIEEHASRVSRQMLGEHVRNPRSPKSSTNLAGRSMKESQRLQDLPYTLQETKALPEPLVVEPKAGSVKIALPGDVTVSDKVLVDVAGRPIKSIQEGGPFYGQGKLHLPEDESLLWASERGPAQNFQNRVNEIAEKYGISEIDAYHLAMGPTATNFAMHFTDANLKAINSGKVTKKSLEKINRMVRQGFTKIKDGEEIKYTFKDFPGVEKPEEAYKYFRNNSEARKFFNDRMKTPAVTEPLNLPSGLDIQWAISDPVLRNMEINLTGRSVGRPVPYAELTDTAEHGTYGKGIRGKFKGRAEYPIPMELGFSDAWDFTKARKRPQDITGTLQKVFPHQVIDQQYLDEIGRYNELVKKYIGKSKGGSVDDDQPFPPVTGKELTEKEIADWQRKSKAYEDRQYWKRRGPNSPDENDTPRRLEDRGDSYPMRRGVPDWRNKYSIPEVRDEDMLFKKYLRYYAKGGSTKKPMKLSPQEQKIVDYHRNTIKGNAVGMDERGRPVTVYTTTIPTGRGDEHANVPGYVGGKIRDRGELQQLFKDEIAAGRWPTYKTGEEAGRRAAEVHSIMDDEVGEAESVLRQMKNPNRVFTGSN